MTQNEPLSPIKRYKKTLNGAYNRDDYDVNLRSSLNNNSGVSVRMVEKIKSNPSFSLQKVNRNALELAKSSIMPKDLKKDYVKLPMLNRRNSFNPQQKSNSPIKLKKTLEEKEKKSIDIYYQKKLERAVTKLETTYMMNLYRQHFLQTIEILRFGKEFKVPSPKKIINVPQKNPEFKTIFLDLDETLIHCDERSNNYTVKLNFPLERGGIIAAGVRIRSFCKQFLEELSKFAEIIIFTASSASYANVILDHLDPKKELISHRLYRHNCTLQKGYYLKDLRIINRSLGNVALVDNSAYCHILQPENGIPIVPFFHYSKDRQLESLLSYLKVLVKQKDMREMLRDTFFYQKYFQDHRDPRKVFLNNVEAMISKLRLNTSQQL